MKMWNKYNQPVFAIIEISVALQRTHPELPLLTISEFIEMYRDIMDKGIGLSCTDELSFKKKRVGSQFSMFPIPVRLKRTTDVETRINGGRLKKED